MKIIIPILLLSILNLPHIPQGGPPPKLPTQSAPPTPQQTLDAYKVITITPDLLCMASVIYGESRGEPLEGQVAVAWTLRNRSDRSGESYCTESQRHRQFAIGHYRLRDRAWDKAERIAFLVDRGAFKDPSGGATHFHSGPEPYWTKAAVKTTTIKNHTFYRSE